MNIIPIIIVGYMLADTGGGNSIGLTPQGMKNDVSSEERFGLGDCLSWFQSDSAACNSDYYATSYWPGNVLFTWQLWDVKTANKSCGDECNKLNNDWHKFDGGICERHSIFEPFKCYCLECLQNKKLASGEEPEKTLLSKSPIKVQRYVEDLLRELQKSQPPEIAIENNDRPTSETNDRPTDVIDVDRIAKEMTSSITCEIEKLNERQTKLEELLAELENSTKEHENHDHCQSNFEATYITKIKALQEDQSQLMIDINGLEEKEKAYERKVKEQEAKELKMMEELERLNAVALKTEMVMNTLDQQYLLKLQVAKGNLDLQNEILTEKKRLRQQKLDELKTKETEMNIEQKRLKRVAQKKQEVIKSLEAQIFDLNNRVLRAEKAQTAAEVQLSQYKMSPLMSLQNSPQKIKPKKPKIGKKRRSQKMHYKFNQ